MTTLASTRIAMRFRLSNALIIALALTVAGCAENDPIATFDGTGCSFEGQREFTLDYHATFAFVNTSDARVGIEIWKVPDGTTIGDVAAGDIVEIADFIADLEMEGPGHADVADPGGGAEVWTFLDVAGDWLLNCMVLDDDATAATLAGDYPALIFHVTDG
ncbi:MAG: hypothetical protein IH943_10600 [Acidobacteria bacterium]|nr:hypothetical protein [Acidobacteriota bacterium]